MIQTFKPKVSQFDDWFYINRGGVWSYLWQDGNWHFEVYGLDEGRWSTKELAEEFLINYERKQTMSVTFKVYEHKYEGWFYICDGDVEVWRANYLWQDGNTHKYSLGLCKGRWSKKYVAEKFLMDYERKVMNSNKIKLEQVTKDIGLLQLEAAELAKKVEDEKRYIFKAGDVVVNTVGHTRIILRRRGDFSSFSVEYGDLQGSGQEHFEKFKYKKIGELKDYIK